MMRLGLLLLAAGGSRRMGHPKALIEVDETTLIQNRLTALAMVPAEIRIVVLGSHYDQIAPRCQHPDWQIFQHTGWEGGMGTSVAAGAIHLLSDSTITHILIALLDQPFLRADHFMRLVDSAQQHPEKIIAAGYLATSGAPAIFPASYFPALTSLSGDKGARKIIQQNPSDVVMIPMPEAGRDWDTPMDVVAD